MAKKTKREVGWVERYVDADGKFRWSARGANGEILADSAEGYATPLNARHGLEVLAEILGGSLKGVKIRERPNGAEQTTAPPASTAPETPPSV